MITRPWQAERLVDSALAKRLIRSQFPRLAVDEIRNIGQGWDNVVYLVDRQWVFRFPRREIGAELLAVELAMLPLIAPELPLSVPLPIWNGSPGSGYPWPFAGYRHLAGRPACRMGLSPRQRVDMAMTLGRFLRCLHDIPVRKLKAKGLPDDKLGRLNLDDRIPQARERLEAMKRLALIPGTEPWLEILETPPRGKLARPSCLVHGDFYACHLLVGEGAQLSAVIDWGDVHDGDPAVDLMIAFSFLEPGARPAFEESYGPIDPETHCLAKFRALCHSLALTLYAHDTKDGPLLRECLESMDRLRS